MNATCLKGFLDCSNLPAAESKDCSKMETIFRSGLLILSFAVFSFLIGPEVQKSLPKNEQIAMVTQSRHTNIRPGITARSTIDTEKAKAVLALGLITVSNKK